MQGSPLRDHLPPGCLITELDDRKLGSSKISPDIWTSYLTGSRLHTDDVAGWCVEKTWYLGKSLYELFPFYAKRRQVCLSTAALPTSIPPGSLVSYPPSLILNPAASTQFLY